MSTKNVIFSGIIFSIILSCASINEYGKRRIGFHIEKIKPNSNPQAYKIIDTSKVYLEISTINTFDNSNDSERNENLKTNPTYLKFYKDGRVGEFDNPDFDDIEDFNPRKAKSYLYELNKDKFIVQVYFNNPQCGECFVKQELIKISDDTLKITMGDYISTYIKKELPKSYLIYKPEW